MSCNALSTLLFVQSIAYRVNRAIQIMRSASICFVVGFFCGTLMPMIHTA